MLSPLAADEHTVSDSKARLRLWLRMLRTTRRIESELRQRLRGEFDTTLPRFDVMAALYRQDEQASSGLLMSEISRALLVSNGNVTGIVDRLVDDGLATRTQRPGDRRTSIVRLSDEGRRVFESMAAAHERWIDELLGHLDIEAANELSTLLKPDRHAADASQDRANREESP